MTYDTFWTVTFGDRSAEQIAFEFGLVDDGLDEWLGSTTHEAAVQFGGDPDRDAYEAAAQEFHGRVLGELRTALLECEAV